MATREVIGGGLEGLNRFDALTQEIEEKFSHFHSLLETRRVSLLERVKKMRELYQQHQELREGIKQLEEIKRATNEVLKMNVTARSKETVIKACDDDIEELTEKKANLDQVSTLKFVVNSEEFSDCVKKMHLREIEAVEYSKRREPLVMEVKRGLGDGEVINPKGISIDDTSNEVFIVDCYKDLVYIYTSEGDFIRKFGEEQLNQPYGICLSGKFLFVSSPSSSVISKFSETGRFVKITSLEGQNAIQLKSPRGLCIHNEFVYICNFGHNRIEVLKLDLTFVKNFGEDKLEYPEDIKLFKDQIFVLVQLNSTIHTFNTEHNYLRSIHFTGLQSQISHTFFFTIDNKDNFIVSDFKAGCMKVFNPSGECVETLGEGFLILPQGIAIDNQQRIVVINSYNSKCFQIY